MAKADGFAVMDVATGILNDTKFRRLWRLDHAVWSPAFVAYFSLLAESWAAGQRLTVEEAWPSPFLDYDPQIIEAMTQVGLLDADGRVPAAVWSDWFETVHERREQSRARWREAQRNHRAKRKRVVSDDSNGSPRGHRAESSTLRSVPNRSPSNEGGTERGRADARGTERISDILPRLTDRQFDA